MSQPKAARKKPTPAPLPVPEAHRINLLPISIDVTLFVRHEDYKAAMRRIGVREENWHAWPDPGCAWVATYQGGEHEPGKHSVVCLGDVEDMDGIEIAATLCHEAVHVWQAMCDHIGERRPADEQSAYAIQNIALYLMRQYVHQIGLS